MNSMLGMVLPLVLLLAIMYFLLIRPQKKREREVNEMRSNLHVGDEIITIGGICGKIVKTKEETIVLQVGADRVKMEMMRWCVSKVVDTTAKKDIKPVKDEEPEREDDADEETGGRPKRLKKKAAKKADESADAKPAEPAEEAKEEASGDAKDDAPEGEAEKSEE